MTTWATVTLRISPSGEAAAAAGGASHGATGVCGCMGGHGPTAAEATTTEVKMARWWEKRTSRRSDSTQASGSACRGFGGGRPYAVADEAAYGVGVVMVVVAAVGARCLFAEAFQTNEAS